MAIENSVWNLLLFVSLRKKVPHRDKYSLVISAYNKIIMQREMVFYQNIFLFASMHKLMMWHYNLDKRSGFYWFFSLFRPCNKHSGCSVCVGVSLFMTILYLVIKYQTSVIMMCDSDSIYFPSSSYIIIRYLCDAPCCYLICTKENDNKREKIYHFKLFHF